MSSTDNLTPSPDYPQQAGPAQHSARDDCADDWGYEAAMPYLLMLAPAHGDGHGATGPAGLRL